MPAPTLLVAEIGVNHNGDIGLALELLRAARDAGADIVKLQTYHAEEVMTAAAPLADYMTAGDSQPESFLDLARRLQLSRADHEQLIAAAAVLGIELLSSPFDVASIHLLRELGFRRLKLPSGELVNPLMLRAAAATGLPLIVSTGMADLEEVGWAVDCLRQHRAGPVALLHCQTQYPAEFQHLNLSAMQTLRDTFGLPVGFSDHTPGCTAAVAAVALGATIIEKHFTLDKRLPGPDHQASLTPDEFAVLARSIRQVEAALGDGVKQPTPPERVLRPIARKSLVVRKALPAGTTLTADMLTAKRPATGIPARAFDRVIGRRLARAVPADCPLQEDDIA